MKLSVLYCSPSELRDHIEQLVTRHRDEVLSGLRALITKGWVHVAVLLWVGGSEHLYNELRNLVGRDFSRESSQAFVIDLRTWTKDEGLFKPVYECAPDEVPGFIFDGTGSMFALDVSGIQPEVNSGIRGLA